MSDNWIPTLADLTLEQKDALLRELVCGWPTVAAMVANARGTSYRPTCRVDLDTRYALVADIFDAEMERIGESKRAHRPVYVPWCTVDNEPRVAELERRQLLALAAVRSVLQMIDAADGGAEVVVPLLRAKTLEALRQLETQDAKPLLAEGVHPHLVKRVQRRDDNVIGGDEPDGAA